MCAGRRTPAGGGLAVDHVEAAVVLGALDHVPRTMPSARCVLPWVHMPSVACTVAIGRAIDRVGVVVVVEADHVSVVSASLAQTSTQPSTPVLPR